MSTGDQPPDILHGNSRDRPRSRHKNYIGSRFAKQLHILPRDDLLSRLRENSRRVHLSGHQDNAVTEFLPVNRQRLLDGPVGDTDTRIPCQDDEIDPHIDRLPRIFQCSQTASRDSPHGVRLHRAFHALFLWLQVDAHRTPGQLLHLPDQIPFVNRRKTVDYRVIHIKDI